jgi:starch synthase (maltosyl-transferring)
MMMPPRAQASQTPPFLRSYAVRPADEAAPLADAVKAAAQLGFSSVSAICAGASDPGVEGPSHLAGLERLLEAGSAAEMVVRSWLRFDRLSATHSLACDVAPRAFSLALKARGVVDPRKPLAYDGLAVLSQPDDEALVNWWAERMAALRKHGAAGFLTLACSAQTRALATHLRAHGYEITEVEAPMGQGAPAHGPQYVSERRGHAPLDPGGKRAALAAAACARGWAMAAGFEAEVEDEVRAVNRLLAERGEASGATRALTGADEPLQIVLSEGAAAYVHNASDGPQPLTAVEALRADVELKPAPEFGLPDGALAPGATLLFEAHARAPVKARSAADLAVATAPASRVIIAGIEPLIDGGAFAVKRVVGEPLQVEARIFADGHLKLAAELLTKAADETAWRRQRFTALPNDVWTAQTLFSRVGRHLFQVEAWVDVWGGFAEEFAKKRAAGADLTLETREAAGLIEATAERTKGATARALAAAAKRLAKASPSSQTEIILSPELATAMAEADERAFLAKSPVQPVTVDRPAARFSSWYELFPRSQTDDPDRPGGFADVAARLPRIAAMGFDTVYFPPIHPIGEKNRKGRNNALVAMPDDLGSPYAIGGKAGGHDAVHPGLGTLEDFRGLIAAARALGLNVALDFAIQCSPDHPWISQHPDWFDWRPDGTIKYAENPPKKYEDIVNVDFYRKGGVPALWKALRDVVLFWAGQGVKTFRVDNPHTKPLAFWEWMIAEVKAQHADAIFLSEAFTRPGPMYHLAKVGFSQSYTYFTWRNTKYELTEYFNALNTAPVRDFFRPHLFVNTPDINPFFLQTSGRAGFLIRAALAATLSGLFGVYAGFEFCEAAPLPGREEYLDSEKYQVRVRPDRAPGDIVDEITQLNTIRRAEPALQTHLGLTFHNAFDDYVLYYSKRAPGERGLVLVAVSLDPHHPHECDFEAPLWLLGQPDHGAVRVHDLLTGRRSRWSGKIQHLRLTPEEPYAIWRLSPPEDR